MGFLILLIAVLLVFNWLLSQKGVFWKKEETPFKIPCPVPKEFCQKWKKVNLGENYVGVGVFLPEGTPFYTPFGGLISYGRTKLGEQYGGHECRNIAIKTNDGYEIIYYFLGESKVIGQSLAAPGQELGTVDGVLPPWGDISLLVSLSKDGKEIELSNKNFEL
ncbi:MAG: hypothetical protein H5T64_07320 [Chloroflexi bacterium]|nr:hypothetical protein [Chloroflexota bacterium]